MNIVTRNLAIAGVTAAVVMASIVPALAATPKITLTPQVQACLKTARQSYNDAIKAANATYAAATKDARATLKSALKAAGKDKTARKAAQTSYSAAVKADKAARQAAKKTAQDNLKAASASCKAGA